MRALRHKLSCLCSSKTSLVTRVDQMLLSVLAWTVSFYTLNLTGSFGIFGVGIVATILVLATALLDPGKRARWFWLGMELGRGDTGA